MREISWDLYPYDDSAYGFLKILLAEKIINVACVYIPNSWKIEIDRLNRLGVNVRRGKPQAGVNNLFLLPTDHIVRDSCLLELIKLYLKQKKKVVNSTFTSYKDRLSVFDLSLYDEINTSAKKMLELPDNYQYRNIPIPVICICGLTENSGKLLLQYEIKKHLEKEGKKVLWICSSRCAELIHAHENIFNVVPADMNKEIVKKVNKHIIDLIEIYTPDVLIIGIPGGILPINRALTNDFGLLYYIISNAINVDYSVLTMPYEDGLTETALNELKNLAWYRFGNKINAFCVINKQNKYIREGKGHIVIGEMIDSSLINIHAREVIPFTEENCNVGTIMEVIENK